MRPAMAAIEILTSPVIPTDGVLHGWATRAGGVSTGKRASLNLGTKWGDAPELVAENHRRLAAAAGYRPESLLGSKHVHGVDMWFVDDGAPPPSFDILATSRPGDILGAYAADCVPLLFVDPVRRVVAAAHSGWRGTVAGLAQIAVEGLIRRYGTRPRDLRVALGPCISAAAFEVGPEVTAAFRQALPGAPGVVVQGPHKEHVDLRAAMRAFLERTGVPREQIDDRPPCTFSEPDRFFSYRRDGQATGIHMGFVGLTR